MADNYALATDKQTNRQTDNETNIWMLPLRKEASIAAKNLSCHEANFPLKVVLKTQLRKSKLYTKFKVAIASKL